MVPLMIFGVGPDVNERLQAHCDANLRDRVSGFEIFPTALLLAGYDGAEVRRHYFHSLFDSNAPREGRAFASGDIFERGSGYDRKPIRGDPSFYLNRFELPQEPVKSGSGAP